MAGTEQPKPTIIGTNDFPGRPILRINLSITKAARAMYPESSSIESMRNIEKITGINVATVWIPEPTPSARTTESHPGAPHDSRRCFGSSTTSVAAAISKKSMNALPIVTATQNIRYITTKKYREA